MSNTFIIRRGELVTSLANISDDNEYMENGVLKKWSRAKVARLLKKLQEQGHIKIISDTYGTHISICNYGLYQDQLNYKVNKDETTMKRR